MGTLKVEKLLATKQSQLHIYSEIRDKIQTPGHIIGHNIILYSGPHTGKSTWRLSPLLSKLFFFFLRALLLLLGYVKPDAHFLLFPQNSLQSHAHLIAL